MIQIKNLEKGYGNGVKALDGIDLEAAEGEILALLGPNGAGKTTTIRVLTTLAGFDNGQVSVAGYDVDRNPEKVRVAIGLVAQNTGIDFLLTGRENLQLQGQLYRLSKAEIQQRIDELAGYFELKEHLDRPVMQYSGGIRRRLDIACSLIHKPKVLFLDEPTLGLDIQSRQTLWRYIRKLNEEYRLTIILTTHYLEEAAKLAHTVAIINKGKIKVTGTPQSLMDSIGGQSLVLTFQDTEFDKAQLTQQLSDQPFVKDHRWHGNDLHLYVDNGAQSVLDVTRIVGEAKLEIQSIALAKPTLDDVFLKYTGATLGDSEESEGSGEWWEQWAGKGGNSSHWQKKWQDGQNDAKEESESTDDAAAEQSWNGGDNQGQANQWWDGNNDGQQDWSKQQEKWSGDNSEWPKNNQDKPNQG